MMGIGIPKKLECVAIYVLSSICAKPPKAPTMPSSIWNVACVLMLKRFVKLSGLLGSPGIPPGMPPGIPPYMPPYMLFIPPYPPPYPPPYMLLP